MSTESRLKSLESQVQSLQGLLAQYLRLDANNVLSGHLQLAGDPKGDLEPASKHYVDHFQRGGAGSGGTGYWGAEARTSGDPTLHDAYTPTNGPHLLQSERTAWNGTKSEVEAARLRTVKAAAFPDLEHRLDAMEGDLAGLAIVPGVPHVPSWYYEKLNIEEFAIDHGEGDFTAFTPQYAVSLLTDNGNLVDLNAQGASRTTCWGQRARYTTELTVLQAKTIQIEVSADNACEVWLNGAKVPGGGPFGNSYGGGSAGSLAAPTPVTLVLTQGRNLLQVRYFNDNDGGGANSGLTVRGVGAPLASLVDQILAAAH